MNKCESDLAQSKLIADKHAKEFHKEMEKIKNKHDKEVTIIFFRNHTKALSCLINDCLRSIS